MLQNISNYGIRYVLTVPAGQRRSSDFTEATARQVLNFHRTIPGYQPTRLVRLPALARRWGVAWAAERLGLRAVVYMPKGSAQSRVDNIRAHGATVQVTDLNYDDTVRLAGRMARENGWHAIQDTVFQHRRGHRSGGIS